jgi:hypothetical protein
VDTIETPPIGFVPVSSIPPGSDNIFDLSVNCTEATNKKQHSVTILLISLVRITVCQPSLTWSV